MQIYGSDVKTILLHVSGPFSDVSFKAFLFFLHVVRYFPENCAPFFSVAATAAYCVLCVVVVVVVLSQFLVISHGNLAMPPSPSPPLLCHFPPFLRLARPISSSLACGSSTQIMSMSGFIFLYMSEITCRSENLSIFLKRASGILQMRNPRVWRTKELVVYVMLM